MASDDAGKTWEPARRLPDEKILSVASYQSRVWAGGHAGKIFYSTDDGRHWAAIRTGAQGDVVQMSFSDAKHGVLTTSNGEQWRTEDGGKTWSRQ